MTRSEEEAYMAFQILAGGVLAECEVCGEALPLRKDGNTVWGFVHESRLYSRLSGYPNCRQKGEWGGHNSPMNVKDKQVSAGGFWIKPTRSMLKRAKKGKVQMATQGSTYGQPMPEGVARHRKLAKEIREAAKARRQAGQSAGRAKRRKKV